MNKGIGAGYRALFRNGSRMPSRYPCRCTSCGRRQTLRRQPGEYQRAPKCRSRCKGALRIDWYRMAAEWHVRPCRCDEYSFPHAPRRGFCKHNPAVTLADRERRYEEGRWS